MDILVLGGSGFIGTRLISRLYNDKERNIRNFDIKTSAKFPNITYKGDVRSLTSLSHFVTKDSIIINLAAVHSDDIRDANLYHQVNVEGAINLCEIARRKSVSKIIFTSSVAVYGFAPIGTDENGKISPFNEYGRTKYEAEKVLTEWQNEDPKTRVLVIIRPTVVFGERNRGNVYNLFSQIFNRKFVMVGDGLNKKSMAYVENVAAFIEYSLDFTSGVHIFNYIDKPDYSMNDLIKTVNGFLGRKKIVGVRVPVYLGLFLGYVADQVARIAGKQFPISLIRIKKFCANSVFNSRVESTSFKAPVRLEEALKNTIRFEFIENSHNQGDVFFTE